ncbi:hypothetical protein [Actinoplanes palleronii]|uniref:hypothetical protein n=1 Tax=Actinoplanes palleronii TaxID=113570 RepID=UPI00194561BE|nr:hypothetical protein [Actinoplanes palleronii]
MKPGRQAAGWRYAEPVPALYPGTASEPVDPSEPVVEVESSGRHTVPDELVRAATYKLAADRVARAKVIGPDDAAPAPANAAPSSARPTSPSSPEPGGRPPVPRPRGL